jgi:hypothetical protein
LGTAVALVALATTGAFWLLDRSDPATIESTLLVSRPPDLPGDVGFDVTQSRGCGAGDLPGFTRARWANPQSGFLRADGMGYLQCQIHQWGDEGAATADFTERVTLLDGVATFTRAREPDDRMQRLATANDGPAVVGKFAGVVTVHSYVEPPVVAVPDFEKLVADVLVRMQRGL